MTDEELKLEYLYFARAYLVMATLGIDVLIEKELKGAFTNPVDSVIPVDHTFERNFLLAPILYNIKHSIEIVLKTITRLLGLDFQAKHDINLLYRVIEPKLLKITSIETQVRELGELIDKYHKNRFIIPKLNSRVFVTDEFNDLFRYPESRSIAKINFNEVFPDFNLRDLTEIKEDVSRLFNVFNEIGLQILGLKLTREELEDVLREYYSGSLSRE